MANPKLSTLADPFTGTVINTALWSNITGGTATLDTVNDLVVLQQPTVNGAVNTFGSTALFDATGSAIYAEVGPSANGNGGTRTTFKLTLDANNSVAMRLQAGAFVMTLQTAGTTVTTTLATYDPNAHGWWRLRESAGSWNAETSADGLNWVTLLTSAYTWSALGLTFAFQTAATVTEAAGNVATLQHVNSMLGGPFNINWPVLEEGWAPRWDSNGGDSPLDMFLNVTLRSEQQSATSRGKQYELDQVQSGSASLVLTNNDGLLDPDNAAGPYFGHIQPAQPYRKRAMWPPARNLLTQVQATAGDLGGWALGAINASNSGPSIFTVDPAKGSFVTSASAWQGGTVMQFSVPSGTAAGLPVVYTPQPALTPGLPYTVQLQARNVTASTTIQVYAYIATYNAARTLITLTTGTPTTLTGGTAPAWTNLSMTATIDAGAAYARVGLLTATVSASTTSVQVDGWQLEQAPVASAWTCPGVWSPWYAGFTDEWAAEWRDGGTYGTIAPILFDVFGLLSQKKLLDALTQEINNHSPRFLYQLDDPAGSTAATDASGQNPAAPLVVSKYGAGSAVFGTAITAANPTTGLYTGSSGTVLTLNNPNPGANGNQAATFLSLSAAGIKGPANPSLFTRMIAFRYTGPTPASSADIWCAADGAHSSGSTFTLYINNTGHLAWAMSGPTSGAVGTASAGTVTDSNWHLLALTFDGANASLSWYLDGASLGSYSVSAATAPTGMIGDNIGTFLDPANGNATTNNWQGDLSFVAEFPSALSSGDVSSLYSAWKAACTGESTGARYSRILRYAGYIGQSSVQAGLTTSMGPAAIAGQDALSALQAVVDTESGQHYVDAAGTVTFRSRAARYNAFTPVYTFGERADLGEWPYENAKPTRDSTRLANDVDVTQASTGQVFSAESPTAQTSYFPKSLTRTINSTNALECQDAANYLLSRYVNPATRVQTLLLHPAANPAMWPVCLSLELGMRIRVKRRPFGAPPITVDCFIEQIQTTNDGTGDATWTLQCSPVDLTPYGVFASFHTTLNASISSGVTSITINAGADNTNLAAAQLCQGQQLVLGQNTANQETVTIQTVGATSPGWSTCAIALQAATSKSHTAGDVVCEPLPSGVTDPTTYDSHAMFDSIAFSY